MFSFKFKKNQTINENLTFFEEEGGGVARRPLFINCNLNYYWKTYEIVPHLIFSKLLNIWRIRLLLKFIYLYYYRQIYGKVASKWHNKWRIWILWVKALPRGHGPMILESMVIQTHKENFNILAQLGKCLEIEWTNLNHPTGAGETDFKNSKEPLTERWFQPTAKNFSTLAQLENV